MEFKKRYHHIDLLVSTLLFVFCFSINSYSSTTSNQFFTDINIERSVAEKVIWNERQQDHQLNNI
ncbi:MAG: hypothetical protein M0Q54_03305, partial [Pigmentiphaga sp.]|nr:hypothetical protein [Pigmentiphaga sp.]